jgi:hypothetical protein
MHRPWKATVISWGGVALVASLTTAVAQQRATQPPLFQGVMMDAKGNTVGRAVVTGFFTARVVRQIKGVWVSLSITPSGFYEGDPLPLFYQSTDCTGTAYLSFVPDGGLASGRWMGINRPSSRPALNLLCWAAV